MESVPTSEIKHRISTLQELLHQEGIALALIRQAADLYYYSGTLLEGFLALAPHTEPVLLVRRPRQRLADSGLSWPLVFYQNLKELPALLIQMGLEQTGPLGLELDVMPAAQYLLLREKIFPHHPIVDLAPLVRRQRMIKSSYEIEQIRLAAAMLDQVYQKVPEFLQPGLTELDLAATLEYKLRLMGHQGLIRVRTWNLEQHYGHVLSGTSGLVGAYTDTPSGGLGFSPAFPQGASKKKLVAGEPISIDLAACVNGYVADMTRMYVLGGLPPAAGEAYRLIEKLYQLFESMTYPGVMSGMIHSTLWDEVRRHRLEHYFMGPGPDRVSFLGHGVGLELDELPVITARFPFPLEADMVLAFEPKLFLPGIGMIGQEDTGRITPAGVEWLTRSPRRIEAIPL